MQAPSTILPPYEDNWPPNYVEAMEWRQYKINRFRRNPTEFALAKAFYALNPISWINEWTTTYDPRNAGLDDKLTYPPLILFKRQAELVQFVYECLQDRQHGLVEKCREFGATWVCAAISVHIWLFLSGSAIGWGSRKQELVDKLGVPDSIFEKMRILIRNLPEDFYPKGFDPDAHMSFMRIMNPETGSSISGDVGDGIGRGARKLIFFKDEAQPLNAKVLTPTGWATIADMEVGKEVIGADGLSHLVTKVKDCGVRDIYRLTFGDGTSAECSPGHLWQVKNVYGKVTRSVKSTKELAESYIYNARTTRLFKYRIPICEPIQFADTGPLPLNPYVVGVLLGDGSVGRSPIITSADPEIIEEVKKLLPTGCVISSSDNLHYAIIGVVGQQGQKKGIIRLAVEAAGIFGYTCYYKFIPDQYKFSSPENRLSLLQGLMDTDGHASYMTSSFHSSSKQLALDVRFLIQSLGGTATLNVAPNYEGFADMYIVTLAMPEGVNPFRLTRKKNKHRKRKWDLEKSIQSIALVDRRPTRCLSIESADGLYLTDDCNVTHNSAHYEHPEEIEASLMSTADVQIDISSVFHNGFVFQQKRDGGVDWSPGIEIPRGKIRVLVLDRREHPLKTDEWYQRERQSALDQGLLPQFKQEIDRDYAASVEGVIIPPEHVQAAIDAHIHLQFDDSGAWMAGFDVADEGGDFNALAVRKGVVLKSCEQWTDVDVGVSTRKVAKAFPDIGYVDVQYDAPGLGAGVKGEYNRLVREGIISKYIRFVPWNGGGGVIRPDGHVIQYDTKTPLNKDFFGRLKAQAWWDLKQRFERTHRARNDKTFTWTPDQLISISSTIPQLRRLEKQLSQPTVGYNSALKMEVNKKPDGMRSPDMADAVVMCFYPASPPRFHATPEAKLRMQLPMRSAMGSIKLSQRFQFSKRKHRY